MKKPNVLFLVTSFIRFKEDDSAWFDHLRLCAQKGVSYDVVAPHDRENSKGFEILDKIRIHRFRYFFPKSLHRIAYYGGAAHNLSKSLLAKIQLPFFMVSFFLKALRNARNKNVYHAIFLPSAVVAVILKKLTGKPFVFWVQRLVFGKGLMRKLNHWILVNCDFVMFNSSYLQKKALKEITPKRHMILHMGVNLKNFKPMAKAPLRKRLGIPQNKKIVFAVGRFVEKKGFPYLIEAMNRIKTKNVLCLIGGFGPLEEKLKQLVKDKGLEDKVKFVGLIPNKEVSLWLNATDVFVVPSIVDSRGETETLGIVAVEGIACGKPVIASRVGGLVDVVKDGLNGFLVKEKSPLGIAEKIDLMFSEQGLVEQLGKNARKFAKENFSEKQAVENILSVYNQVLE